MSSNNKTHLNSHREAHLTDLHDTHPAPEEKLFSSPLPSLRSSSSSSSEVLGSCPSSPELHTTAPLPVTSLLPIRDLDEGNTPAAAPIDEDSFAVLERDIIAYVEEPQPLVNFFRHPVHPDDFWDIWNSPENEEIFEGCSVIYNPKTLTLQIKRMSFGHHENGAKWCRSGYKAMLTEGFIPTKDSAECLFKFSSSKVGLLQEPENKLYVGFDKNSAWKDMTRVPDWSIMRLCDDPDLEKPLIVMETGVSQRLQKSVEMGKRESLQDRAEAWLSASYGITKAVILIDIKDVKPPSNDELGGSARGVGDGDLVGPMACVQVRVQLWRMNSTKTPCMVENHVFVVSRGDAMWSESEVPNGFPKGITLFSSDFYDTPEKNKSFVLPIWCLRNTVLDTWTIHERAAGKRKRVAEVRERKKARAGE